MERILSEKVLMVLFVSNENGMLLQINASCDFPTSFDVSLRI